MDRYPIRFAQADKIQRQALEVAIAAAVVAVVVFPPWGLPIAIGLGVVAYQTNRLASAIRSAMGFSSNAEYKAFKFTPEGQAIGQAVAANISLDPFFVDPAAASPALQQAQKKRLLWRKVSFTGGIAAAVMPIIMIGGLLGLGAAGSLYDGADFWGVVTYVWVALWILALLAAFGGLFAAFASRLKIQKLTVFGG